MQVVRGDLLRQLTAGIMVHGCNCQGVMGKGFAKSLRAQYPEVFLQYARLHAQGGLQLGSIQSIGGAAVTAPVVQGRSRQLPEHLLVVNAMTQLSFGTTPGTVYVDYDAVFSAFAQVRLVALHTKLPVHFPLIGTGAAQGDWSRVQSAIRAGLRELFPLSTLWVLPNADIPASLEPSQGVLAE